MHSHKTCLDKYFKTQRKVTKTSKMWKCVFKKLVVCWNYNFGVPTGPRFKYFSIFGQLVWIFRDFSFTCWHCRAAGTYRREAQGRKNRTERRRWRLFYKTLIKIHINCKNSLKSTLKWTRMTKMEPGVSVFFLEITKTRYSNFWPFFREFCKNCLTFCLKNTLIYAYFYKFS